MWETLNIIYNNWMCEAAAIAENIISNTCHRIRNRDGGEAAANSVFRSN